MDIKPGIVKQWEYNMALLEMNATSSPEWVKEFQKILESEYNISRTDAIFITGAMLKCQRKYREPVDEDTLSKLAQEWDFHNTKKQIVDESGTELATLDSVVEAYKAGYRRHFMESTK